MSNCFEVTSKFGNICSFKSDSVNKGDKVYTSPQYRELSDDEIVECLKSVNLFDMKAVAKAILERAKK